MAKIAYVDHSYHKKTLSTKFLPDILENHGHTVDWFWDESWKGGEAVVWEDIVSYDAIIMFQSFSPIFGDYYINRHPCITYIPMLDQFGIWSGPMFNLTEFWEPFQGIKVLNFSTTLHGIVTSFGIKSKYVRYFQEPCIESSSQYDGLHGFVWIRREDQINWNLIKKLIGDTKFDSFHIHATNDPGTDKIKLPSNDDIKKYNITVSTWFDKKSDFEKVLQRANVYFTPRMEEGIGQSFLEALNRGQCVVAPNNGTMNEYIIDGITGLLYDHENPRVLDFSNAFKIGKEGKKSTEIGYKNWKDQEKEIVEYILTPNSVFYEGKYNHVQKTTRNSSKIVNKLKYKVKMIKLKLKNINNASFKGKV